jgi:hypothetical protein
MDRTEIVKKLESFLDLKENWDSYGAEPICPRAISKAIIFASNVHSSALQFVTEVVPTVDEGVEITFSFTKPKEGQ